MRLIAMIGRRFGRLVVLDIAESRYKKRFWHCRCDCGKECDVNGYQLRCGSTRSCGCLVIEHASQMNKSHGMRHSREYRAWSNMRRRCYDPSSINFHRYGLRGIRVCDRWKTFEAFLTDMGCAPTNRHQIDRIDNDGDYEPDNCRWVTSKENNRNRSNNLLLQCEGWIATQAEWAELATECLGINRGTVLARLQAGWPLIKALSRPARALRR